MKKFTLMLVAVLAMLSPVKAQDAQSVLTYQWAHTLEGAGNAANNVFEAKKAADGSYWVANKIGTKTGALTAKFDGTVIDGFEGATYSTAATGNLYLQKVNADGSVAWSVRSAKSDVSAVNVAPTSDGGAVLFIKSRVETKDGDVAKVLTLIDAAGKVTEVGSENTAVKTNTVTIAKIDKDGKCEWTRLTVAYNAATTKVVDGFTINDCAVDDNDNIYIAGKFSGVITLEDATKRGAVLVAGNDTSDLFVFQLDKDGYYKQGLTADDNEKVPSAVDRIVFANGKLYVAGTVTGDGLRLTGKKVQGDASFASLFLAAVNTDYMEASYVKSFASAANANAAKPAFVIQNKALNYVDGNLYLTGALNGGLTADGVTVNTNSTFLKGMVVKASAEDGKVLSMGINDQAAKGITNYFGVYEGANTLYTFGYDMAQSSSAILFTYDKSTLAKQGEIKFSNLAGGAANAPLLVDGNKLLMMTRGKAAKGLTFLGTDTQLAGFSDWGVTYCLYGISDVATGIKATGVAAMANKVNVYTLSGICVKQQVSAAEATQGLAKGIYVVGNQKVVVK